MKTRTQGFEQILVTIGSEVAQVQEYRTALITAAVTGKIDVRGNLNTITS